MEAEILEILSCRIEKEMLSWLHTYIESLSEAETHYLKRFLERRRAAMDEQSSVAQRMQ
jgi:hypothetical protein